MRNKRLLMLRRCSVLFMLLAIIWCFCGYMIHKAHFLTWSNFESKIKKAYQVHDMPYAKLINAYSAKNGLNPQLVAAVIQAESSFMPKAVSTQKAYGLMQIIPETWRQINQEIHICQKHSTGCTIECYTDPELNIGIGTYYLAKLIKKYDNHVVLALAAYNAGPQVVDNYRDVPPYAETQAYINAIINNWYLISGEKPPEPIDAKYWENLRCYAGIGMAIVGLTMMNTIWRMVPKRRRRWR